MKELPWTYWRGIGFQHPASWEEAAVSGPGEEGHCLLVDLHGQRLDVRWHFMDKDPQTEQLVERLRHDVGGRIHEPEGLPAPWRGIARQTPQGLVTTAGRIFQERKCVVEADVIWPDERNVELEQQLLQSVHLSDPASPERVWGAMGLHVTTGTRFELREIEADVGRITWNFEADKNAGPWLTVQRIALPAAWLTEALRGWLESDQAKRSRLVSSRTTHYAGHEAEQVITVRKKGGLGGLFGQIRSRSDVAWQCESEGRVYRVAFESATKLERFGWPGDLAVVCCGTQAEE